MESMTLHSHSKRRPVISRVWVWSWLWLWVSVGVGGQFPEASEVNSYTFSSDGTYSFSYDTGSGQHQSFRSERRDSQGRVSGRFGYLDPDGALRVTSYSADSQGYRATMEVYQRVHVAPDNPLIVGPIPQQPPVATPAPRRQQLPGATIRQVLGPAPFEPPQGPVLLIGPLPKPLQPPSTTPDPVGCRENCPFVQPPATSSLDLDQSSEEDDTVLPGSVPPPPLPRDLLRDPPIDEDLFLPDPFSLDDVNDTVNTQQDDRLVLNVSQQNEQPLDSTLFSLNGVADPINTQLGGSLMLNISQQNQQSFNSSKQGVQIQTEMEKGDQSDTVLKESEILEDKRQRENLLSNVRPQINQRQIKMQPNTKDDKDILGPLLQPSLRDGSLSQTEFQTQYPTPVPDQPCSTKPDCTNTISNNASETGDEFQDAETKISTSTTPSVPPILDDNRLPWTTRNRSPLNLTPLNRTPLTGTPMTRTHLTHTSVARTPLTRTPLTRTPMTRTSLTRTPLTSALAPLPVRAQDRIKGRTRGKKETEGVSWKTSQHRSSYPSITYLPVARDAPYTFSANIPLPSLLLPA